MTAAPGAAGGVWIVLPTLNEARNIVRLLERIEEELRHVPYQVCVVDDGSRDGTVDLVRGHAESRARGHIHLIERKKTSHGSQRGIAVWTGLQRGLQTTDADVFVEMDADLSHRPEELITGVHAVRPPSVAGAPRRADVAIASKYLAGSASVDRPLSRRALSRGANFMVRLLVSRSIRDFSNGYRFYSRAAVEAICRNPIRYGSPIYLTEALARALEAELSIAEFPSTYLGRAEGLSKLRLIDLAKASVAVVDIACRLHWSRLQRSRVRGR